MKFITKKPLYIIIMGLIFISNVQLFSQLTDIFDHPEYLASKKTPYSTMVKASFIDDKDHIYVGIWGKGIYKSTDKGATWQQKNSGLTNLFITDIKVCRSGNIILSTYGGGVFQTADRGNKWLPSSTGIIHLNVKALAVHPNGFVFAGTFGGGMYMSKDDGFNWTPTNIGFLYRNVTSLEISNAGYVIAGTYGGGMYASRDTGKTWLEQNSGLKTLFINDVIKNKSGVLLAATNGRGIYESPNDGLTWAELDTFMIRPYTDLKTPLPDLNATTITMNKNFKTVFGTRYGGCFYFDDVEDFTWVSTNVRGTGINSLLTHKDGSMFAFANEKQPQYTETTGETWDDKPFILEPKSPKIFILGKNHLLLFDKDGNFFVSNDDGESWTTTASLGFELNSVARDSSGNLFAGSAKGLYFSAGTATDWTFIRFKDTMVHDVEVAPNGTIWITTTYAPEPPPPPSPPQIYRHIYKSTDGGYTWVDNTMDLSSYSQTPQKIGIKSNNTVYMALTNFFFYTSDNGFTWRKTNTLGTDNQIQDVAITKDDNLYAATYYGLYKSASINTLTPVPLFMAFNTLVHVDRNGAIYGAGKFNLPNNYSSINLSYRSLDTGQTFTVLNNSYNSDNITSISSDPDGNVYFTLESGGLLKALYPKLLNAPKLVNLPNKAQDVGNNNILSWEAVENAELYQLQISIDSEFIFDFESVTLSDLSHQVQSSYFPNTEFYWRVRSKNNAAVSNWSEVRTFISKLATPKLVSPDSNSVGIRVYAPLVWHKVPGATKYELILSKKNNFTDTVFHKDNITDTTITTSILEGLTKYYWKVRAKNTNSTSLWSNVWNFTTVLGPPKLLSPANKQSGLDLTINFNWNKAIQATSYKLLISENQDFTGQVKEIITSDTFSVQTGFNYDKWGWWKISSVNKDGESEFSEIWSFRTAYSPVSLLSPENGKGNIKLPVTIKWQAHETQSKYDIYVAEDENFTKNLKKFEKIENVTEQELSDLAGFTKYFWKARVISDENTGVWSETYNFRTILGKAGLRSPADGSKGLPTEISFLWFNLQGANRYHLQIALDEPFEDLVFSQDTLTNFSIPIKDLPNNSKFYWRVRGVSDDGYGEWSEVWSFTTSGNAPSLSLPANGSTGIKIPLKFKWFNFTGAVSYKFQLSDADNFDNIIAGANNINYTEHTITTMILEPLTTYYWKVQANLESGESNWSQVWSFTTDEILSVDEIESNSDIIINPNPFSDAVNLQFNLTKSGSTKIIITDITGRTILNMDLGLMVSGLNTFRWNPVGLTSGKYFVRIINNEQIIEGELIYQK